MHFSEHLVAVIIVFIVIGLPILSVTLIILAKIMKGNSASGSKSDRKRSDREEAEIVQELHHNLTRLEKRIESLETIILDRENQKPSESSEL